MKFDPIKASANLEDAYRKYLASSLRFGNPGLQEQFENQLLTAGFLAKGPLLEATPPYTQGSSIRQLVTESILCDDMLRLDEYLPADRPLYTHQESAIRNVATGRNQAIVTGTGSGKTECFLIPIFDHLLRQSREGELGPGVRALILYPMNALANDQLKRLRTLLADVPEITFGRYTGETKEKRSEGLTAWKKQHPGVQPCPNELLSREEIRDKPPHILLTNYAMLEYLLLRPSDAPLFDGLFGSTWSHLVIDEAHVYSGTLGTEIAYLVRRLKARLRIPSGQLRCMATSATIGSTEDDHRQVARFASDLFGEPFSDGSDGPLDVVTSTPDHPEAEFTAPWGQLDSEHWAALAAVVAGESEPSSAEVAIALANWPTAAPVALMTASGADWAHQLGRLLLGEIGTQQLLTRLGSMSPLDASDEDSLEILSAVADLGTLSSMVDVLSRCRRSSGAQLLSARYHSFLRAPEGAFISLLDPPQLYLTRQTVRMTELGATPVYEVASCRHCGQEYLLAHQDRATRNAQGQTVETLTPESPNESDDEEIPPRYYLVELTLDEVETDTDEDQAEKEPSAKLGPLQWLCPACGSIHDNAESIEGHLREHEPVRLVGVRETKTYANDKKPCVRCGYQSAVALQRARVSPEAAGSVLVYDLIRRLPPMEGIEAEQDSDDGWGTSSSGSTSASLGSLICFSDRRQDAAFFAPSLERTYGAVMRRQALYRAAQFFPKDRFTPSDWAARTAELILSGELIKPRPSVPQARKLAWAWVLGEMMSEDGRASLEGLGLIRYAVRDANRLPIGPLKTSPWNLTENQAQSLLTSLIDTLRAAHAVQWQEGISTVDQLLPEHWVPMRVTKQRASSEKTRRGELSWLPSRPGASNSRLDYARRTLSRLAPDYDKDGTAIAELLSAVWRVHLWNRANPLAQFMILEGDEGAGTAQAHPDLWEIEVDPKTGFKRCDACARLVVGSELDTCPTYRCVGRLVAIDPESDPVDTYYRQLYRHDDPIPLTVEEHTGQLRTEYAAQIQEQFLQGKVNVLSCTTTFELGVDVGDLRSVFMRNVPPSPANYVQRSGRTGRRSGTPGFALTFARLRSHDLAYYAHPEKMISGRIPAPSCYLSNEKIAERHVYAVALSEFFRSASTHDRYCGRVSEFFNPQAPEAPGLLALRAYLASSPPEVLDQLTNIVPPFTAEALGIEDWSWVAGLVGEEGRVSAASKAIGQDWHDLADEREFRLETGKPIDWITRAQKRIGDERVIARLASHGALPKYGFPTDLVELSLPREVHESANLEMQRGLRMAVTEYAPGSEVVAAKKVWQSAGLRRIPGKDWETRSFWTCRECGHFQSKMATGDDSTAESCPVCDADMGHSSNFVIPQFGFVARQASKQPGQKRPRASGGSRTYYSRDSLGVTEPALVHLPGGTAQVSYARNGRLYVINRGPMGTGYRICPSCGGAGPTTGPKNVHMRGNCSATVRGGQFLGTWFETDVLEIGLQSSHPDGFTAVDSDALASAMWACVLSASEMLMVPEGEVSGTEYWLPGGRAALLIYDDVPGGAGRVYSLADRVPELLETARERVSGRCGCGEETSCYSCLRAYKNQFMHDRLTRAGALAVLNAMLI